MNDNLFSEKDSLELISQMLRQTKRNMEVGSGNIFLYYGYSAFIISIVVFVVVYFTANQVWAALWFLMFVPNIVIQIKNRKERPPVVTYMDKAIANTWSVIGAMFMLTIIAIIVFGFYIGFCNFALMLPLSLLYAGIGTAITGVIMNVKVLIYAPLMAFFVGIYMLAVLVSTNEATVFWHLYFGLAFIFMMIIPGHVINRISKQQCLKN